jgi:hypothetical protein
LYAGQEEESEGKELAHGSEKMDGTGDMNRELFSFMCLWHSQSSGLFVRNEIYDFGI